MIIESKSNWFDKLLEYAVYFFVFTFPFINYSSFLYFGTSTRSINLIVFSSIVGIILGLKLFFDDNKINLLKSPVLLSLFLYVISVLVSALNGLDFNTSFYSAITRMTGIWYLICLGFFILILINVFKKQLVRKKIILLTVISTSLYSVLSFFGPEGVGFLFKGYSNDGFTFGNSTFAGMYLFGAFLLSIYYLLQSESKRWWMCVLPVILVINPYITSNQIWLGNFSEGFAGEARASTYAVWASICALVFLFFISKIKKQDILIKVVYSIFTVSFIGVFYAAYSLLTPDGFLRNLYLEQASAARPLVWELSTKRIAERPMFGWGTDNFERVFESNYDSRILEQKFGGEPWFDRAHNIFIDQTFDNGFVGLSLYGLIYAITAACLIYVLLKSKIRENKLLASILIIYFGLHILELQTAFDTSISYFILAIMFSLAIILFQETFSEINKKENTIELNSYIKYLLAAVFIIFFSWSLFSSFLFIKSQIFNGYIREVGSAEKRIPAYKPLFSSPVDLSAVLWRTVVDFQRGVAENPKILEDSEKVDFLRKELGIFEEAYKNYIIKNQNDFRALLSYANIKIYFMLFGVNKLEEAQYILDKAIKLSPNAPQPYWMKSVAYLYARDFNKAREYAKKSLDLNSNISGSREVGKYIEDSIKTFPEIDLYFFKQI